MARLLRIAAILAGIALSPLPAAADRAPTGYKLTDREGGVELRAYAARWVVETQVSGERDDATHRGFLLLEAYLAADDGRGDHLPLPLRQPLSRTETSLGWTLQLDLPADAAAGPLAQPTDPRVSLHRLPAQSCLVMAIDGTAGFAAIDRASRLGLAFALAHGLAVDGPASVAFYTAPAVAWFLQRAEFRIPVAPRR